MSKREAAVALVLVVGVVVAFFVWRYVTGSTQAADAPPAASTTPSTTTAASPGKYHVLVAKIDNVAPARPQTGVGAADVVYVEQVEGGLTRIAAVYCADPPPVVGPVRSARFTDLGVLAQYGRPALAFSGAASTLLTDLRSADIIAASPARDPAAYFRNPARPAPHDLYVHPARLPHAGAGTCPARSAPTAAPAGGTPTRRGHVGYPSAHFGFQWSPQQGAWRISMNGTPLVDTASGRVRAHTVVIQQVTTGGGPRIPDAAGHAAPNSITTGHGKATVLLDGRSVPATWSRPAPSAHTTYRTASGATIPLGGGPAWILLVPS